MSKRTIIETTARALAGIECYTLDAAEAARATAQFASALRDLDATIICAGLDECERLDTIDRDRKQG